MTRSETSDFRPLGARVAAQVHEEEARVRQTGQRIGERVFLRLLANTIELLITADACSETRSSRRR